MSVILPILLKVINMKTETEPNSDKITQTKENKLITNRLALIGVLIFLFVILSGVFVGLLFFI